MPKKDNIMRPGQTKVEKEGINVRALFLTHIIRLTLTANTPFGFIDCWVVLLDATSALVLDHYLHVVFLLHLTLPRNSTRHTLRA